MLTTHARCHARLTSVSSPITYHTVMNARFRISVKDYRRDKNLKILLVPARFDPSRFPVTMLSLRPQGVGPPEQLEQSELVWAFQPAATEGPVAVRCFWRSNDQWEMIND